MRLFLPVLGIGLFAAATACGNPNALASATIPNDTTYITLGAVDGTPIQVASAYSVSDARAVRTDLTSSFDFAYNVDAAGVHVFLFQGVLGLTPTGAIKPGFLRDTLPFDSITDAPLNGYDTDDTLHLAVGDRYIIRSRPVCSSVGQSEYGKLEIVSFDSVAHTVRFKVLVDNNCGYLGLSVGLPPR